MSSIHSYHVYIYIYVCVPYNIPDRINQTNVYTNLYVKATQHFELNFIVLYIYTSLSCVFVSNASKPHPFVKGHMAISYFQRPLRSCKVFKSQLATYFFQMPLRQCHFVKGHVAIFFKGHLGNAYAKQIPMGPGTATESWRSSSRTPGWCHPSSTQCLQDQAIGVCLVQRPFGHSIHVLFIYFFGWQFQFEGQMAIQHFVQPKSAFLS